MSSPLELNVKVLKYNYLRIHESLQGMALMALELTLELLVYLVIRYAATATIASVKRAGTYFQLQLAH
jgi:hypothetical protein